MAEDKQLMEVCKTILGSTKLMYHDLHGHLASGDLDTARDDLAAIRTGMTLAKEVNCPSETVNEIKRLHKEGHDTYRGMLTSKVESIIRNTGVT